MLYGFIGRVSAAPELKQALDISSQRTRLIADRVAKASLGGADGFAATLGAVDEGEEPPTAGGLTEPIDLESEMVALADEQLRFETTARLLQKAYQNIRLSLRDR
jgi:hypothetical protein